MSGIANHQPSDRVGGSVHPRDQRDAEESDHSSSPQRRRPVGPTNNDASAYEHPHVLCFAARNRRGRFYIPCKQNSFGGVHVDNVMVDSGCSSLLLPFPLSDGFPPELSTVELCQWFVSSSRGTGALHSPVLKINKRLSAGFRCTLAGRDQPLELNLLRIHLGRQACERILAEYIEMLDQACIDKLNEFLRQTRIGGHASPERSYALLGQSYLKHVFYCQKGDVALALSNDYTGTSNENILMIMGRYERKLAPMVQNFEGFQDLEDDDGDEDEEHFRLSWDVSSDDEIDEPDDR
jgi:hypothetical protein